MKRIISFFICSLALFIASAVPADPTPARVLQPDGTTVALRLMGDEFYHFTTTVDGYTVINNQGQWEYAVLRNNRLAPSGVLAHDALLRSPAEKAFVAQLNKSITDRNAVSTARINRAKRDRNMAPSKEPVVDYSNFRGLIVLINFTDKQFLMNDAQSFYNDMMNTQNYQGFNFDGRFHSCTGSVRDYFFDQSMGQFDPIFDVAGPVTVPFSVRECGEQYGEVFKAALDSIDSFVDFTKYDSDNDGGIDMVFFLVAGYAASYSGNSEEYLWPHMSYLIGWNEEEHHPEFLIYDGMFMGRYASSTEIYGWESQGSRTPNGIGTVCHEFGHVLGLPDLYDTDYEQHGQSNHPGDWDVMAGGSYGNRGRTPVGYSLWERAELGWAEPELIDAEGQYSLFDITKSNAGYRLNTPEEDEFFLLECRQPTKWDASLPGHGMLIARVDYSNPDVWWSNEVNNNPEHNYYELLRLKDNSPAFPGSGNNIVTDISNYTTPNFLTWTSIPNDYQLTNITENSTNGTVTFNVSNATQLNFVVEDFEAMPATTNKTEKGVQGNFAKWDFAQCYVTTPEDTTMYNGDKACAMIAPSALIMVQDIDADIVMIEAMLNNPSSIEAKVKLYMSTDQGANWTDLGSKSVKAGQQKKLIWLNSSKVPVRFRINITSGPKSKTVFLDDFTINYSGEIRNPASVLGDIDGNGIVDVEDVNAAINLVLKINNASDYPGTADLDGNGIVDVEDVNRIINIVLKL